MKITFVLPVAQENGGTRVVAIHARRLLEMGHDVTVLSRAPERPPRWRRLARRLRGHPVKPLSPTRTRFLDPLGPRHIQIARPGPLVPEDVPDADVIVATWWRTAFEVAALPPGKGAKAYFVQGHEVFPHLPYDLSAGSYYLPLRKIVIAGWLVDTMRDRYGDDDVHLVPNGVDTGQFFARERRKSEPPTVGILYSPTPFKDLRSAVGAIDLARRSIPHLRVVAFGTHDPGPDLPLPEGTVFHRSPAQERLRDIYGACDVWMTSSRSEGFGLPILEAMACGCPVVATRTGVAPDAIVPGRNGYLADVGDVPALAEGLVTVLSLPPDDWRRMSDAARATARTYGWEDATHRFEAALRDIAEGR